MKKQIEVKLKGLNEFGVSEMNEFYKHNIDKDWVSKFKLGDKCVNRTKKRFKNVNEFYKNGLESYIGYFDIRQHIPKAKYPGCYFELQLKHFVHEIFEVEVTEKFTQINLAQAKHNRIFKY